MHDQSFSFATFSQAENEAIFHLKHHLCQRQQQQQQQELAFLSCDDQPSTTDTQRNAVTHGSQFSFITVVYAWQWKYTGPWYTWIHQKA